MYPHKFSRRRKIKPYIVWNYPTSMCVLKADNSHEEIIFVGAGIQHKIFVLNSHFELLFQFGDKNLVNQSDMQIDKAFNKMRLFVSDYENDEITIWSTADGTFIGKIDIEAPKQIVFTVSCVFVTSPVYEKTLINHKIIKINKGAKCIFE
jgi:hypothetical protein